MTGRGRPPGSVWPRVWGCSSRSRIGERGTVGEAGRGARNRWDLALGTEGRGPASWFALTVVQPSSWTGLSVNTSAPEESVHRYSFVQPEVGMQSTTTPSRITNGARGATARGMTDHFCGWRR